MIDATVELQGADVTVDPGDFGTKLATLRRLADDLYTRALKAANVPIRTAALDAVIAAGQAIEVALADIDNDTAAMRGSVGDDTKAAVAAFDLSKTAMNNAAAASLDQLSESDTDVRALAGAARDRQALADLPGAGRAARLDALVATRAAAEKLSEKAKAKFDTEVAGLPAAVPADTDPMPADAQKPFQDALTVGKAAATACQGAVKAAQGVKIAAHKLYAELDAIKNRTAEEDTARTHVDGIRTGADAAISALDARRDAIATALRDVARGAFDWANWAGTNHAGNAANADLQAVAGFGDAARLEMSFPPASEADMIRVGASLQKKPVPGPASVDVAVNGKSAEVDMAHICGRHVRENHTFEGEEAPSVSEHDLGLMLKAQTAGKKNTKEEKRIIEEAGRNKPTSLFPETMTPARAQQLATEALTQADANAGGAGSVCNLLFAKTQPPTSAAWTSAWHDDPNISVDVPPVISATVGIEFAENPGVTAPPDTKIRARMFYPNAGDKMSTPDMLVLAKALGIAR